MQVYYMKNLTVKTRQKEFDYEGQRYRELIMQCMEWLCFLKIQKEKRILPEKVRSELAKGDKRKLSHCVKGNNSITEQKKHVALCLKNRNQRKDFLHKLSYEMAEAYDVVAVEDIDMKAMSQCMHFGKSVMDKLESFGIAGI